MAMTVRDTLAEHRLILQAFLEQWSAREEEIYLRMVADAALPPASSPGGNDDGRVGGDTSSHPTSHVAAATTLLPPAQPVIIEDMSLKETDKVFSEFGIEAWQLDEEEHRKLPHWSLPLVEALEQSKVFQVLCNLVICFNTLFLAYAAEHHIQTTDRADPLNQVLYQIELVLTGFYTFELIVRMSALQLNFFWGPEVSWHMFDLILVLSAIQDVVTQMASSGQGMGNASFLRALRMLKTMKLLRVIRLAATFRELRLVLESLLGSMKSMLWSAVMILVVTFMFGVCFMQAATEYVSTSKRQADSETGMALLAQWGSVGTAMLSLFKASTGGLDWGDLAAPLWYVGIHYYAIFCFYIAFFLFVVMNAVTSIFVDSTTKISEKDQMNVVQDQLNRKPEFKRLIAKLYSQMSKDSSGCKKGEVDYDTFVEHIRDPKMVKFAKRLEVDVMELQQFFGILSGNGRRGVDIDGYVVGCIKLLGMAKSMDTMDLILAQRNAQEEQMFFAKFVKDQFADLTRMTMGCNAAIQHLGAAQVRCQQEDPSGPSVGVTKANGLGLATKHRHGRHDADAVTSSVDVPSALRTSPRLISQGGEADRPFERPVSSRSSYSLAQDPGDDRRAYMFVGQPGRSVDWAVSGSGPSTEVAATAPAAPAAVWMCR